MRPTRSWKGRYQTCVNGVLSYSEAHEGPWTPYTPEEITSILFETYNQHSSEVQRINDHHFNELWALHAKLGWKEVDIGVDIQAPTSSGDSHP